MRSFGALWQGALLFNRIRSRRLSAGQALVDTSKYWWVSHVRLDAEVGCLQCLRAAAEAPSGICAAARGYEPEKGCPGLHSGHRKVLSTLWDRCVRFGVICMIFDGFIDPEYKGMTEIMDWLRVTLLYYTYIIRFNICKLLALASLGFELMIIVQQTQIP